jgi:hypothetical protein
MKKELVSFEGVHCANCGASMQGEFCHECGQSIHTVLRPMHHMVEDTLDMVFHVDGRIVHTLPPLLYRPGFLTLEYFSGRRQRYVAPFRLMFVLCLLAFFVCHLAMDNLNFVEIDARASAGTGEFAKDTTPEAVRAHFEQMRKDIEAAPGNADLSAKKLEKLLSTERDHANHRLTELDAAPLSDKGWSKVPSQVHLSWMTDGMNASLNRAIAHAVANMKDIGAGGEVAAEARERVMAGTFAVLPQTMFILMPLFALLLKLTYVFKRRLYMEHLIVALHSHAMIFLSLLLAVLVTLLRGWLAPHAAWTAVPLNVIIWALWLWIPVYLLIMQKRVYRQGWFMTTLKYLFVGWCYAWLIGFALGFAALLGATR